MNSFIETQNQWGGIFLNFAWPMLWQSSLLIMALFAVDLLLRRKIRASIRYALWLVVLVKLCVPPTLALPTSPAWWLHKTPASITVKSQTHYTVTYGQGPLPTLPTSTLPVYVPPKPTMTSAAWLLVSAVTISAGLLLWLLVRWWQITRRVRRAVTSGRLTRILAKMRSQTGIRFEPRIKLTPSSMSPAVCGLFRPAILIPQTLADNFTDEQLRAVLLHELIHLRRRDVWMNFLQALLQIAYWWHPLVWLANARIRRVREEAVDDAVMLVLCEEAESYAPTLLEVAKLALNRPLASLGLVGILESRHALRQRIERLVNYHAPRKTGLTFVSLLGIFGFSVVALPMGQAPTSAPDEFSAAAISGEKTLTLKVNPEVFLRNIKAKATWNLDSPTDDCTKILLDIMRSETVDCSPPHGIAFNAKTGEITTQNTPEQLEIYRQVIEQLNRPDGLFEMPQIPRRNVLIQASLYWMSSDEREKLVADLPAERGKNESAPHWMISPEQFKEVNQRIASLNLHPFQRPRIQTADGCTAKFWVGNGKTNGVEFDCMPYEADKGLDNGHKGIALVFRTETIGNPAGPKQELTGTNHYTASGEVGIEDRGGFIVSAGNSNGSPTNVVMVISVQLVTNLLASGSVAYFQPQISKTMTFKLDHPIRQDELKEKLLAAGVKTPTTTFFYADSGILLVQGSEKQLALVNRLVLKLNGFLPSDIEAGDKQFVQQLSSIKNNELPSTNLFSRTFKVNTNVFISALQNTPGLEPSNISSMAGSLFRQLGVNLAPPKSVFYNKQLGMLFVRATEADLDTIEQAVMVLNQAAPQIHIKARFLEVPKGTLDRSQNEIGITNQLDQFTGILTSQNTKTLLRKLESRADVKELAEPEATTTSGRQTQMRATKEIKVISGVSFENDYHLPGLSSNAANSIRFQEQPLETGPILDTVPYILSDGRTISLTVIASLTEFFGYEKSAKLPAIVKTTEGDVPLPSVSPSVRIRKVIANVKLYDGQTLVLGKFNTEGVGADNFPKHENKDLLVLITATLVDSAGNRIHSDAEMPFAKDGMPP